MNLKLNVFGLICAVINLHILVELWISICPSRYFDFFNIRKNFTMAWSTTRHFSYSFRSIYYFSRIFCYIPFTIEFPDTVGDNLTSKVRLIDGVLCASFIILHLILSTYFNMKAVSQSLEIPHVLRLSGHVLPALGHYQNVIIIIMNMFNRNKIINIMKMFNTIDKEVIIVNDCFFYILHK